MVFPRMRAWVAGILFLAWLGYLAYLAYEEQGRVIVAGPQIRRSNLVVVASLTDSLGRPAAAVKIQKVLRAEKQDWQQLAGRSIELEELAFFSKQQGWEGPGDYVVPMTREEDGKLTIDRVTRMPLSPNYRPANEITISVGQRPEALAHKVEELTGTPFERLKELFSVPMVVLGNVPYRGEENLNQFAKAIADAGGEVRQVRPGESRIYRATADVVRQVEAIVR